MDSILTPDHLRFLEQARAAAEAIVSPGAARRDGSGVFPAEEVRALAGRGLLGVTIDSSLGGGGRDAISASLAVMEISRACASTGLVAGFHALVLSPLISRRGKEGFRDSILRRLASGSALGALALTDPPVDGAGAAPAFAYPDGDRIVLRGGKLFVPAATHADIFLIYARWGDGPGGAGRRRALLLLPRETPGLEIGPPDPIFGMRAAGVAPLRFADCRIPADHLMGDAEEVRSLSSTVLAPANLAVAAQATGIAEAIFEKMVARASEREPSGSPMGARQPIQWKLADMQLQLDAARLLSLRAASAFDGGEPFAYEALQAKVAAGRAAARIADEAIQVLGGSGAIQDGGVERHWRDAKTTELNPVSREAAQLAIARHLLEEAR